MDKLGHGIYTPMDIDLLPPLHLIYADNPSDSGKVPIASIYLSCLCLFHILLTADSICVWGTFQFC